MYKLTQRTVVAYKIDGFQEIVDERIIGQYDNILYAKTQMKKIFYDYIDAFLKNRAKNTKEYFGYMYSSVILDSGVVEIYYSLDIDENSSECLIT